MNLLQWTCARICLVFLVVASLVGCGKTESENIDSKGVHAKINVVTEGDGTTDIKTRLKTGDGYPFQDDLKLSRGDRLVVYANGVSQEMSEINGLLGVSYITTFPFDTEGLEFRVAFERNTKVSAPNSIVTLPDAFTITTPADLVYADTDIVTTTWTPANTPDRMLIVYRIECEDINNDHHFAAYAVYTDDSGLRDMPVREILEKAPHSSQWDYSNGCSLEVEVVRKRRGDLDRNYGNGGRISGKQSRNVAASIAAP